MFSLMAKHSYS